jgi:hypothetical protein
MIGQWYQTETIENMDGSQTVYEYLQPEEEILKTFFSEMFERHWNHMVFGPCLEGAVFEIQLTEPPRLNYLDGYLTVNLRDWHFHLCLGTHKGSKGNPTPEALARQRRPSKAAFFRTIGRRGSFGSWGFRMWNGNLEQMLTIFFPNPYLSDRMKPQKPDWSRLALWNEMRCRFLSGAEPWSPNGIMSEESWGGH